MSGSDPDFTTGRIDLLASLTAARVGLGRAGAALPTQDLLRFGLAHAQARDAVHQEFQVQETSAAIAAFGLETITVESMATTRMDYLRRPDLGRSLRPECRDRLARAHGPYDLAIVVGDGLSATAVNRHAAPFVGALLPLLRRQPLRLGPVVLASQARVALADEIAVALGARMVLMAIGERPGLSSPDSLGGYITFAPRPGITGCRTQLRLEHPTWRSHLRGGGLQAVVAYGRGPAPVADRRRPQGRQRCASHPPKTALCWRGGATS